jgi:putative transposase
MVLYSYQHGVYQNIFHLTWQTKYRYEMMRQEKYRGMVKSVIEDVGKRHGIVFVELGVMEDHVHAVVDCHPSMSQSKALGLLKGGSSYVLFRMQPKFRLRYPRGHFWSPGKAGRTVGDVDQETVIGYVRRQVQQTTLTDYAS